MPVYIQIGLVVRISASHSVRAHVRGWPGFDSPIWNLTCEFLVLRLSRTFQKIFRYEQDVCMFYYLMLRANGGWLE